MTLTDDLADESLFRARVSKTLHALLAQIDDVDTDDIDARLSEGNLAVGFDSGGTFVLSQQTPTRELWLSANLRAWHFVSREGHWVERDTHEPLSALLSRLFTEKLQQTVHLTL